MLKHSISILALSFLSLYHISAQIIPIGSGSYTKTFPGTDEAGRNGFPGTSPLVSGVAATKPIPTNDWWSSLLKNDIFGGSNNFAENLFNYPISMQTTNSGLVVSYISFGVFDDQDPIIVGVSGLNASKSTVSDFSDWTVTMDWDDKFQATSGIGMPFLYFNKAASETASITVNLGSVTVIDEMIIITDARNGADFVVYAPVGSSWSQNGNVYSSTLNDKNYWSMAMLPQEESDVSAIAEDYKKYAYVFPSNTTVSWNFDETSSVVRSEFAVETDVKEGTETNVLIGLLPHQWDHLANDSALPQEYTYNSVRGDLKTLDGNGFVVENTFHGILPTLPYLNNYSEGFSLSALNEKVKLMENDQLAIWTDSYNEGQVMNRLIQTARIANEMGNTESLNKILATIKERLEDWLTAEGGEVAFLFYYNTDWTTMIGYPAGHGQDSNINDHHFHWGYFIHAAAFLEQFESGWSEEWGAMINLLIRDAASPSRTDELFPFLRNFSPYAGHSWANGMAAFPQGNDQESTSESMQFNSSLIHWGTITGDDEIRDLGIYLYTTEQSAVEEYWFDTKERIFPDNQYSLVSRVWGNAYDNGTFFTDDIAASYGIELYPIHGGSMYLGHDFPYAEKLWAEIEANTGILSNEANDNLWHDIMYQYLAFTDPEKAITLYNSNQERNLKFGVSDAQTYYWIHAMNASGQVDESITADYPVAVAFIKDGAYTYAAHNYSNAEIDVTFSDGFVLTVPASSMATNRDTDLSGEISSSFESAYPGGSVELSVTTGGASATKVEFYDDGQFVGEALNAPFTLEATALAVGVHEFYAKVYEAEAFGVTNIVTVVVGAQLPYDGSANAIPGTIEAGNYDEFEGGNGQGITYSDVSANNQGNHRLEEAVDVVLSSTEGSTIEYIAGGEWVEYTVTVEKSGLYELSFRFASDNSNGGGPFHLLLNNNKISDDISLSNTGGWSSYQSKTVSGLAFPAGEHVLRLAFDAGEFNIGKMTFTFIEDLPYSQPIANAGANVSVVLPESTAVLDGSLSADPENDPLTYLWKQIFGPSVISFADNTLENPTISNLIEGIYKCRLTISDGEYSSFDDVLVIVSETGNVSPTVSITSPAENASFTEGEQIVITAAASDLEESITKVEFFDGETSLGEDTTAPYEITFSNASIGAHVLTAVVTDDQEATGNSQEVNVTINEVLSCVETSSDAAEGSFSVGYKATFETSGNNVTVFFELLDTEKTGVVAFLREETPFSEVQMDHVSGNIFKKTLTGKSTGTNLRLACKFAFAGGLAVTKYFSYKVGADCSGMEDVTAPINFTASTGSVTFNSVELILNGSDDSNKVIYKAQYGAITKILSVNDGEEGSLVITGLTAETAYSLNVTASDLAGNIADNSPIVIDVTTPENTNTACAGNDFRSQLGSFEIGYNYTFETIGTDVVMTFEFLDKKDGVFAFLWRETPFTETQMTLVSGQKYTATVGNQTMGSTIRYGCKFEFAGGLAVTKYFSYEVGDACGNGNVLSTSDLNESISIYPNPVVDQLSIDSKAFKLVSVYTLDGRHVLTSTKSTVSFSKMKKGIYLLMIVGEGDTRKYVKVVKE